MFWPAPMESSFPEAAFVYGTTAVVDPIPGDDSKGVEMALRETRQGVYRVNGAIRRRSLRKCEEVTLRARPGGSLLAGGRSGHPIARYPARGRGRPRLSPDLPDELGNANAQSSHYICVHSAYMRLAASC
jgi:hypothetical protein